MGTNYYLHLGKRSARAQGDCWEIVHIEFPRLRAELAHMWEVAA